MSRSTILERQITDALKSRIAVNEAELDTVNQSIADNDTELSDHESRLATAEQGLADISADGAISNTNLAIVPADTLKGRIGDSGSPTDLTAEEIRGLLIDDAAATASTLWSASKISQQIGDAVTASVVYQGGYDAATNTPDLTTGATTGDFYTVTVAGDFLGVAVEVGDSLIAEIDGASTVDDWTIVNKNIDLATEASPGIVQLASDGGTDGNTVVTADDTRLHEALRLVAQQATGPFPPNAVSNINGLSLQGQDLTLAIATPGTEATPSTDGTRGTPATPGTPGAISGEMATDIAKIDKIEQKLNRNFAINREELTENKSFFDYEPAIQHLFNTTGNDLNISFVPDFSSGTFPTGTFFEIIYNETSNANLVCTTTGDTLEPGDRYEVIYDGVEWVVR